MKKIISVVVLLATAFIVTGCSSDYEVEFYDDIPMGRHIQVEDFNKVRRIKGYNEDTQEIEYYDSIADLEEYNESASAEEQTDYIIYIYTTWCTFCTSLKEEDNSIDILEGIDYENVYFLNGDTLGTLPEDTDSSLYEKFYLEDEDRYLDDNNEDDRSVISQINQERLISGVNKSNALKTFDSVAYPTLLRLKYTEAYKMGLIEVSESDQISIIRNFACRNKENDSEYCEA